MKRILSFVAVMLGLMALSSCMKESIETGQEGSINGTFTISVPQDVVTKAYGDGKFAAKNMIIGVFDENGMERYRKNYEWGTDKFTETITLPFVMGKSYQMVFWAQYGNAYGDPTEMELKEITMPYAWSNQENLDAFYWYEPKFTVTEDFSKNITMRRPFAQVNFATTPGDIKESIDAGLDVKLGDKAVVTVKNAAKTLNLFTGETSDYAEVTVPATQFPMDANGEYYTITVEGKTYEILAMNYFLVADKDAVEGKTTAEMSLKVGELELSVPQAQMKRNYRTNIVGELLTGEGTFTVTIDPDFGGDFNHNGITGDGTEEIKPAFAAVASTNNAAKIDAKGGKYFVDVTSNVAWTVTVPQGLTATPASGENNAKVEVTIPENTTDKEVTYEVVVKTTAEVATKEYKFTITQAAAAPVTPDPDPEEPEEPAGPQVVTVAEFLAAEVDDNVFYRLQGTITSVANTTYGNFDLTDDTGTVYIYGLSSEDGATTKYWADSGAKLGDDIVISVPRAEYNNAPQGKNARFIELISPGTRAFYTLGTEAVDFTSAGGEKVVAVNVYNTDAAVTASSDNAKFTVAVNGKNVTISSSANDLEEKVQGNVTVKVGDLAAKTIKVTLAAKPASGVVEGGQDDFHTISSTNTSYVSGKTTAGWNYVSCAIFKGGTSDSSPAFKMIGDASNRALCMNGKTSAVGTITSPTLTTGCGTLKFNYGLPFGDTKIKFRVDIIQNGTTVKTFTVDNPSATQNTKYSHEEVINVAGDFQIVFTNLSPSNSSSNKDRTAIWDVEWTGCAK